VIPASVRASLFGVCIAFAFCHPTCAQNYTFTYFRCIPSSCVEEGPAEKTGNATVVVGSQCSGPQSLQINFSIQTFLENCSMAWIPHASATVTSQTYENSDTCPITYYTVDYVTATSEVFTAGARSTGMRTQVWDATAASPPRLHLERNPAEHSRGWPTLAVGFPNADATRFCF
jgi:hypothetical protein